MTTEPRTFVLLHGAWHGGWCWERVAEILRARGHQVTTPTQTGLGERSHLMSPDINLDVFTADLVNHLLWEGLTDVTLVGHSFGGCAITGAADQMPGRISRLVYLDALVPISGRAPFDDYPPDVVAERTLLAQQSSGGISIPAPPAAAFGVTEPGDVAWLESRLTPHPLRTFTSALHIDNAPGNGLAADFIVCIEPEYSNIRDSVLRAREHGWPVREIATGHDAMITAPQALADLLETTP